MGFRFRKSIKAGPVRFNLSKSGVSTSVGVKGARITKRADGKTQATVSAPGTGVSYTTTTGGKKDSNKNKKKGGLGLGTMAAALALIVLFVSCMATTEDSNNANNDASNNTAVSDTAANDTSANDTQQEDPAQDSDSIAAVGDTTDADAGKDVDNSTSLPLEDTQTGAAAENSDDDDASAGEEQQDPADQGQADDTQQPADQGQNDNAQQGADASASDQSGKEESVDPPKQEEPAKPQQPVQQEPTGPGVIGNANSHVYHELGCGSVKKMSEKNKRPFASAAAAQAAGYDPCENCH